MRGHIARNFIDLLLLLRKCHFIFRMRCRFNCDHVFVHSTTRKEQNNCNGLVGTFYCWQEIFLSMISKTGDAPTMGCDPHAQVSIKKTNSFTDRKFSRQCNDLRKHFACTDRKISCQWMVKALLTGKSLVSSRQKQKAWGRRLLEQRLLDIRDHLNGDI